jgi:YYY domain-containing protein
MGLLLVSYVLWVTSSLGFLSNDLGGILASLLAVVACSAWALSCVNGDWSSLQDWMRQHRRLIFFSEGLFLVAFVAWAIFRAYDPAIAGTEKPMEFAFLNGILRSDRFPPLDPWLSGYAISYYYFGYVMLAVLVRLSGVASAVGFNLGVASWFALTILGAFSVSYSLLYSARREGEREVTSLRKLLSPLLGPLFVALLGNLEGVFEVLHARGLASEGLLRWLDVKDLGVTLPTGRWIPTDNWWWWRASRVIHDRDLLGRSLGVQPIDEFPFFSFLLGDMHPHVLALPFVLFAIGLGLNLVLYTHQSTANHRSTELRCTEVAADNRPRHLSFSSCFLDDMRRAIHFVISVWPMRAPGFVLYALALGGLGFLNTWDFPIYLFLVTMGFAIHARKEGAGAKDEEVSSWAVRPWFLVVLAGGMLGGLGFLLYLPFYLGFSSQASGMLPNLIFPTRLNQFSLMFGTFLVALSSWFLALSATMGGRSVFQCSLKWLPWTLATPIAMAGGATLLLQVTSTGQMFLHSVLSLPEVQEQLGGVNATRILAVVVGARLRTPGTSLLLAMSLAWALGLLQGVGNRGQGTGSAGNEVRTRLLAYVLLMAGTAFLLAFAVEWVYLKDTFGVRMNTVFKFYYQAWVLMALASAYAMVDVGRWMRSQGRRALISHLLSVAVVLLVGAGLVYTVAAGYSKANGFQGETTLDGLAYLRRFQPDDAAAIDWLRANIKGAPVVLEAAGGSYSQYNRVSMATGLPTLLGWDGHELQWRGDRYGEVVAGRPEAIDRIYRLAKGEELLDLMRQWDIEYLYVGNLEREKYRLTSAALNRFEQVLRKVYENGTVRIYQRPGS